MPVDPVWLTRSQWSAGVGVPHRADLAQHTPFPEASGSGHAVTKARTAQNIGAPRLTASGPVAPNRRYTGVASAGPRARGVTSVGNYDREKLQERLAKLAGGVAVIKVGTATEVELKERKHRIEDAVRNAKAAVEEGLLEGGGVALSNAVGTAFEKLDLIGEEATGANIVKVALAAPLKQIAINARHEGGVVAEKVGNLPAGYGLNAETGEYVDMFEAGIVEPAKVTGSALQNAAPIAALFLTTEAVVADKPEKGHAAAGAPRNGRHGLLKSLRGAVTEGASPRRLRSTVLIHAAA